MTSWVATTLLIVFLGLVQVSVAPFLPSALQSIPWLIGWGFVRLFQLRTLEGGAFMVAGGLFMDVFAGSGGAGVVSSFVVCVGMVWLMSTYISHASWYAMFGASAMGWWIILAASQAAGWVWHRPVRTGEELVMDGLVGVAAILVMVWLDLWLGGAFRRTFRS